MPSVPLPASLRHGYGVGALSLAITNTAVMFFLLKYLVDGAHLSPAAAGTALLVGKIWDAVIDPTIGRLTDRTRTRMGSRRPWMLAGTPLVGLLFAAVWSGADIGVVGYALLLVAYNTAYSMVAVPYGALTPSLSADYDERTRLNAARMGWSMVGGIVSGVGVPLLLGRGGWPLAGLVLGVAFLPPMLVTVWATRGRDVPAEEEPVGSLLAVLKVGAFRRTAALFVAAWTTIAVLGALVPFYVEHHLGRPERLDAVFAVLQLSALAAIPGVVKLSEKLQKHVAYAVGVGVWSLVLMGLAALPADAGDLIFVLAALVGPGVAAAHVLPWAMLPDVIEADRAETGQDRAGSFYGLMTFLEQAGTALALWGLGMGLQLAGYVEGAATQPDSARLAIRLLIGPVPGVVLLAAAAFALLAPPMTREAHRALLDKLGAVPR